MRLKTRRGSSIVYIGFSLIAFVISFGFVWQLVPTVLGAVYSALHNVPIDDPVWAAKALQVEDQTRGLITISISMGITMLFLKILMVASNRGRD